MEDRPPLPPFNSADVAQLKVRLAEDMWNSRDPAAVAKAYTANCLWRNRTEILKGRDDITAFLVRKWSAEQDYRLIKELWGYHGNRMAVRFAYEWHNDAGAWFRSYGNELWEFAPDGLMQRRIACINDLAIREEERLFHWVSGRRPDDHASLTDLDL